MKFGRLTLTLETFVDGFWQHRWFLQRHGFLEEKRWRLRRLINEIWAKSMGINSDMLTNCMDNKCFYTLLPVWGGRRDLVTGWVSGSRFKYRCTKTVLWNGRWQRTSSLIWQSASGTPHCNNWYWFVCQWSGGKMFLILLRKQLKTCTTQVKQSYSSLLLQKPRKTIKILVGLFGRWESRAHKFC